MAVAAAFLLAGCGGGGAGDGGGQSGGAINPNATFKWATSVGAVTLDPQLGNSDFDLRMMWPVYDSLTYINPDGGVEPMLAKSWELAPDGSSFTLALRDGVTFSDGAPLNAAAVKASLDRGIAAARSADFQQLGAVISSIDAVDEMTVRLNLKGPGGALPFFLGGRAGMIVSPKALGNSDLDRAPVGAGAFKLVQIEPGVRYVYERRSDYWDKNAYRLGRMELGAQADDSTRLNAMRSGQLDASFVREAQIAEAKAANLTLTTGERLAFYSIDLNTNRSKFADRRVRQALSLATDRKAIDDGIFAGLCAPTAQPFPEGYFAHSDKVPTQDWVAHDPERARKLLAEAGLPDGFSFTAIVPSITAYQTLAQVLQQQYAEIGVKMAIQTVTAAQSSSLFSAGSADAVIGTFPGAADPSIYSSATYLPGPRNPGKFVIPGVQELHNAALKSPDLKVRGAAYANLLDAVYTAGPTDLPICSQGVVQVSQPKVHGLKTYLTGTFEFRDVTISP